MTTAPVEVEDWTKASKSFSPAMRAQVAAPTRAALETVAAGLTAQGFRVKDATPTGFRASYRELVWGILGLVTASDAGILDRTVLAVEATPSGEGAVLTITVAGGGGHRPGRKRGCRGLTAAFQDLQQRGIPVTTTPWAKERD